MKRWMQTGIVYGVSFCLATVVWIALFHTSLFAFIEVFFYRGIILLFLTSVLLVTGFFWYKQRYRFGDIGMKDIFLCVTLFFSFQMLFFTHIPVTAERSVSVFLLSYLDANKEKQLSEKVLERQLIDVYVYQDAAVEKRIAEQIQSGTVTSTQKGIHITSRGSLLILIYKFVGTLFGMHKTILFSY